MPGDAWNMQSNIKAKPGSQGTLFQPTKSVLNPAQRWPRGYTPERQAEVSEGMTSAWGRPTQFTGGPGQRARVVDAVARSTVPSTHLFGLEKVTPTPNEGSHGTYHPRAATLDVDMFSRNKGDAAGQTLLHELGHHHVASDREHNLRVGQQIKDVAVQPNHIEPYRTSTGEVNVSSRVMAEQRVNPGVHEAHADNYMVEHYRTRGRSPQKVTQGAYEQTFVRDRLDRAYPGYSDVRPHQPPLGAQFDNRTLPLEGMDDGWARKQRAQESERRWAVGLNT